MCEIGLPGDTGTAALPSIIGPARQISARQKSHNTGGWAGSSALLSVVTLVAPHRNCWLQCIVRYRLWPGLSTSASRPISDGLTLLQSLLSRETSPRRAARQRQKPPGCRLATVSPWIDRVWAFNEPRLLPAIPHMTPYPIPASTRPRPSAEELSQPDACRNVWHRRMRSFPLTSLYDFPSIRLLT